MNNPPIASVSRHRSTARPMARGCFAALVAGLLSVCLPVAVCRAQPAGDDEGGAEVLTRGPVHEAFAGVVSFNPEPGIVVTATPPDVIDEIPPEEKPEGDDVAWIPGYWAWDDERNDFIWISGTWRALPPGREWMAGYWRDTGRGYQWISGYWADAAAEETDYLPPPPASLEIGANLAAPSDDYGWTPGCWVWQQGRYAWRAGYWTQGRADWVWVPACYVWTPRGVIFVDGYWDYPVERRGMLFAPVYYQSRGYARRGYSYSPAIVINLSIFADALFLRPSYHHYYFGDYYDPRYEQGGFYASFSYQSSRAGYDPFYAYSRWEHRSDRDWADQYRAAYQYRRDHVAARPPRTWAAQLTINTRPEPAGQTRIVLAVRLDQLAARRDNPVRFQPVARDDRQKLAQRGREVQNAREERRTIEAKAVVPAGRNGGQAVEPARVSVRPSPIVARPAGSKGRNQAPPEKPQAPRPDPKVQPRAEAPGRQPNADQRNAPSGPDRPAQPERNATVPRETKAPPAAEQRANAAAARAGEDAQRKVQQDDERRNREADAKSQAEEKSRQAADERASAVKDRDETRRKSNELQAQQDDERRTRDANARGQAADKAQSDERASAARGRDEAQQKAQQQQAEGRAAAAEAKARDEAPQRAVQSARDARPEAGPRANDAAEQPGAAARAKPAADQPRGKAAPAKVQEAPPRNPKEPAAKEKPADDENDDAKSDKEKGRGR